MKELFNKYQNIVYAVIGLLYAVLIVLLPDLSVSQIEFATTFMIVLAFIAGASNFKETMIALAIKYDWAALGQTVIDTYEERSGVDIPDDAEKLAITFLGDKDKQYEAMAEDGLQDVA